MDSKIKYNQYHMGVTRKPIQPPLNRRAFLFHRDCFNLLCGIFRHVIVIILNVNFDKNKVSQPTLLSDVQENGR